MALNNEIAQAEYISTGLFAEEQEGKLSGCDFPVLTSCWTILASGRDSPDPLGFLSKATAHVAWGDGWLSASHGIVGEIGARLVVAERRMYL